MPFFHNDIEIPKFYKDCISVAGYFAKFRAFLKYYEICDRRTLTDCLILSLEGESLELFLILDNERRLDLEYLEGVFLDHFEDRKHEFVEQKELFSMRKTETESFSRFGLRISMKARRVKATDEMKTFAFKNGIPGRYVIHLAKKKAKGFQQVVEECEDFEKFEELEVYLRKQEEISAQKETENADGPRMNTRGQRYCKPFEKRRTKTRRVRRRWPKKTTNATITPGSEYQTKMLSVQQRIHATEI